MASSAYGSRSGMNTGGHGSSGFETPTLFSSGFVAASPPRVCFAPPRCADVPISATTEALAVCTPRHPSGVSRSPPPVGASAPARRSADAREPASDSVPRGGGSQRLAVRRGGTVRAVREATRLRGFRFRGDNARLRVCDHTRCRETRPRHERGAERAARSVSRAARRERLGEPPRSRADASQAPNARLNKTRLACFEARFATCHARTSCAPRAACHRPRARATATRSRRRSRAVARHA